MDIATVSLVLGKRGAFRTNVGGVNKGDTKVRLLQQIASKFIQLKALGVFLGSLRVPGSTACSAQHSRGALFDLVPKTQLVLCLKQNSRRQSSFPTQVGSINHCLSG